MIYIIRQKSSSFSLCNVIPPVGIVPFKNSPWKMSYRLSKLTKISQTHYIGVRHRSCHASSMPTWTKNAFLIKPQALPRAQVLLKSKVHQLNWHSENSKFWKFFKMQIDLVKSYWTIKECCPTNPRKILQKKKDNQVTKNALSWRKLWDLLKRHSKAYHQHTIVRGSWSWNRLLVC